MQHSPPAENSFKFLKSEHWEEWFKSNRNWLGYLLVIALLAFPYELINFSFSVDEEYHSAIEVDGPDFIGWINQGRWGMHLVSYLFPPHPIVPFTPLLVALVFSALAFSVVTRTLSRTRTRGDYFSAPLFIACPTLYYIYHFNTISYGIGIASFCAAAAVYIHVRWQGKLRLAGIPLLAFAIGIYQSVVPWVAVLFCFYALGLILQEEKCNTRKILTSTVQFILFLAGSVILFFLVGKIFYVLYGIESSGYIGGYFKLQWSWAYWELMLRRIDIAMKQFYSGDAKIYAFSITVLPLLVASCLGIILFLILRRARGLSLKVIGIALLLCIMVVPFSFHLINSGIMPTRSMLAIPLVFSGLVFFSWLMPARGIRIALGILAIAVSFSFMTSNNRLAFANAMAWQADRELTVRLLGRLDEIFDQLPEKDQENSRRIELVGSYNIPDSSLWIHQETIGASFYNWDGGNPSRAASFMRTMGHFDFRPARISERRAIMERAYWLPSWPRQGSVAVIDGIIVIKLADYTNQQRSRLCGPGRTINPICRIIHQPLDNPVKVVSGHQIKQRLKNEASFYRFDPTGDSFTLQAANKKSATKNTLHIEALTRDPKILLPEMDASPTDYYLMNLSITTRQHGAAQFFWKQSKQAGFGTGGQVHLYLKQGENHFSLLIPGKLLKYSTRIDPGNQPGLYTLSDLEIYRWSGPLPTR